MLYVVCVYRQHSGYHSFRSDRLHFGVGSDWSEYDAVQGNKDTWKKVIKKY